MHPLQRTARIVSYVLNPLVLPPILFGVIVFVFGGDLADIAAVLAIGFFFFALLPLIPMIQSVKKRPGTTLELRDRRHRTVPYAAAIGSYALCIPVILMAGLPAEELLAGIVLCFAVNGVLLLLINLYWKISLHVATLAGCLSILVYVTIRFATSHDDAEGATLSGMLLAASLGTGLVMWARVRDDAHSVSQVMAGALFGALMPVLVLFVLEKIQVFDTF